MVCECVCTCIYSIKVCVRIGLKLISYMIASVYYVWILFEQKINDIIAIINHSLVQRRGAHLIATEGELFLVEQSAQRVQLADHDGSMNVFDALLNGGYGLQKAVHVRNVRRTAGEMVGVAVEHRLLELVHVAVLEPK